LAALSWFGSCSLLYIMAETNVQMVNPPRRTQQQIGGDHPTQSPAGESRSLIEEHAAWPMMARLPVMLSVKIPLRGFKVCHLLALRTGQSIGSAWAVTEDVPLKAGALQLCWGEFEVVNQQMALRLTRLA
jgi:hypothetical protein